MAYKEVKIMEIREIIRRRQSGQNISEISKAVSRDRKTVRKYLKLIEGRGMSVSEIELNSEKVIGTLVKITEQMRRKPEKQDVFFAKFPDGSITGIDEEMVEMGMPTKFELFQNYTNPFNPSTIIQYSIPAIGILSAIPAGRQEAEERQIQLKIYDVLGREVAVLVNEKQPPGTYKIEFNALNLTSGIYFYQLSSERFSKVNKMILMR